MSNSNSTPKRGSYICKVGHIDIYQKCTFSGEGKKRKVTKHELVLFFAKSLIQGGFKTKEAAIEKANELMAMGIDHVKSFKK